MIETVLNFVLHFDQHLNLIIQQFGLWAYLILFLIIFAETGLVIIPLLPGDSLLFALGAFAAGSLNVIWLIILLSIAGILGDAVNYAIGKYFKDKLTKGIFGRFIKQEHLDRTHAFYEKYGGKTIVIARFIPIIRTFAPFVAGIGRMGYAKFAVYNILGGIMWVSSIIGAGYFFGNIRLVKENFSIVVLIIIFLSILPGILEYLRHHFKVKDDKPETKTLCDSVE